MLNSFQIMKIDIPDIVCHLRENLGLKITAYLSGIKDADVVGLWANGKVMPYRAAQKRLFRAYQASKILIDAFGKNMTIGWFFGTNEKLQDKAPAYVLRYGKNSKDLIAVVLAARAFVGTAEQSPAKRRNGGASRRSNSA